MRRTCLATVAILLTGCGGGSPSSPGGGGATTTITLTSSGASPTTVNIAQGARVIFVNNDSRSHNMTSDPHPAHDQPGCGALNAVGFLQPGQSRESGNLTTVGTCGFHDHDNPPDNDDGRRYTGSIRIQ